MLLNPPEEFKTAFDKIKDGINKLGKNEKVQWRCSNSKSKKRFR